jgi:hypothetical protein
LSFTFQQNAPIENIRVSVLKQVTGFLEQLRTLLDTNQQFYMKFTDKKKLATDNKNVENKRFF